MLTYFSKWLIYTASYFPLYFILIFRILFAERSEEIERIKKIHLNYEQSKVIIWAIIGLLIISIIVMIFIKRIVPNSRNRNSLEHNVTFEVAGFLIPYFISTLTIDINLYGWIINLFVYIVCGCFVVIGDTVQLCPVFLFLRYRLYKDSEGKYVFTKLTKEQYNLMLVDDVNGLQSKSLTYNVSLVTVKKF